MCVWRSRAIAGRAESLLFAGTDRVHQYLRTLRGAVLALCVGLACVGASAQANLAIQKGLVWLNAQVLPNGALASQSQSIGTPLQTQSETALTLSALAQPASPALTSALQAVQPAQAELLARQIAAGRAAGASATAAQAQLAQLQVEGGGLAPQAGFRPGTLDSAWALRANERTAQANAVIAASLVNAQNASGSWGFGGTDDLGTTAEVLLGLNAVSTQNPQAYLGSQLAASWLLARQAADGSWGGSAYLTALAYRAVHPFSNPATVGVKVRDYLIAQQLADGSWGGDPLVTALALRALHLTMQTPQDPTRAIVKGRVIDALTRLPLAGVAVTLSTSGGAPVATQVTGADGAIALGQLVPQPVQFRLTRAGYSMVEVMLALQAGATTDVGDVLLLRSQAAETGAVVVSGTVRVRGTGAPLAGATVAATPAGVSAVTDIAGQYALTNLPPGQTTVAASKAGYVTETLSASMPAGVRFDFSPTLNSGQPSTGCTIEGQVTDAVTGLPLQGVTVINTGSTYNTATTAADGRYTITGVGSGASNIKTSRSGYKVHGINIILACSYGRIVNYSPALYDNQTPIPYLSGYGTVTFVVVDAGTNQPIPFPGTGYLSHLGTSVAGDANGRITIRQFSEATMRVTVTAEGYAPSVIDFQQQGIVTIDGGQVRLRKTQQTGLAPDFVAMQVQRTGAGTDPQTLLQGGTVSVVIGNAGASTAPAGVAVLAFADIDRNGKFDAATDPVLGQSALAAALPVNATASLSIAVAGALEFRDAPISVVIDPYSQVIEKTRGNNVRSTADEATVIPAILPFTPKVKFIWDGDVMMTPVVGRIHDTNGDGRIDELDTPRIIFASYPGGGNYYGGATLRAIDGITGQEVLTVPPSVFGGVSSQYGMAIADLDGDGIPEIVASKYNYGMVILSNTGALKAQTYNYPGNPAIADINGDGIAEILMGPALYSNTGVQLNNYCSNGSNTYAIKLSPTDTGQAVICGDRVWNSDGSLRFNAGAGSQWPIQAANFNDDPYPEFLRMTNGNLTLFSHTGQVIWGPVSIVGVGGVPVIADLDGDGYPDIGVAGRDWFSVFRHDGSMMWRKPIKDGSANTGATAFDFHGNGRMSIVYRDEQNLYVFDGPTGSTIFQTLSYSLTGMEHPIVADIDGDGHADIVVPGDAMTGSAGLKRGIVAYTDINNAWAKTRSVWNQFAYNSNNINDDLSVPRNPAPSFLDQNTFVVNRIFETRQRAVPDLTVGYVRVADAGSAASTVTFRVGNAGSNTAGTSTQVAVYGQDASGPATLITRFAMGVSLAKAQYVDLVAVIPSLGNYLTLSFVADDNGGGSTTLADFDRTNNRLDVDVRSIASSVSVAAQTDRTAYAAADTAILGATISNLGSFPKNALARFTVLAADGRVVEVLPVNGPFSVGAGQTASAQAAWPVTGLLAGGYLLKAELLTSAGVVYGVSTTSFAITGSTSQAASARISADRASYSTADLVTLTSRAGNLGSNTVLENLQVTTVVRNAGAAVVWQRSEDVAQLAPGAVRSFPYAVAASALGAGDYTAHLSITGAGSLILATATAPLQVLDSAATGVGLRGTVTASATAEIGQPLNINLAVFNAGDSTVSGSVTIRVVNPVTGVLVAQYGQPLGVAVGATQNLAWPWTVTGIAGQQLVVTGSVQFNGRDITLGQTVISLTGAPAITVLPPQLAFGATYAGATSAPQQVMVTNSGSAPAASPAITLSGSDPAQFIVSGAGCAQQASLAVGATCTVTVTHSPSAVGAHTATLNIAYSDVTPQLVTLTGTGKAIQFTGGVTVAPSAPVSGQDVSLGYTLVNPAPVAAQPQANLAVYDNATSQILATWNIQPAVAAGATFAGNQMWTPPAGAGQYRAVLSENVNSTSVALSSAVFSVSAAPVTPTFTQVEVTSQFKRDSRILVLVSCVDSNGVATTDTDTEAQHLVRGENATAQPDVAACVQERVQGLHAFLDALGIPHKVVTTDAEFRHEMRCGIYNTYWISGPAGKLDPSIVKEVRDAVWRGDGLILDGVQDDRNLLLHAAAGVAYRGRLAGADHAVDIVSGQIFEPGVLDTVGQPTRMDLQGGELHASFIAGAFAPGASVAARAAPAPGASLVGAQDPAIVSSTWGRGRSLMFGFDLAAMAASPNAMAHPQITSLVTATAAATADTTQTLTIGDAAALAVTVTNNGTATVTVKLVGSLPAGVTHSGASIAPVAMTASGTVTWSFDLASGVSQEVIWRVSVQQATGVALPLWVYGVPATGSPALLATPQFTLSVTPGTALLAAPLPAAQALQPAPGVDTVASSNAVAAIASALALHNQAKYPEALAQWMNASKALLSITSVDVTAARDAVAMAAEATSDMLCQGLACVSGALSLSPQTVIAGANINVNRVVGNMCTPQVKDIAVKASLVNRRTAATVLALTDVVTLNAQESNTRNAVWPSRGQNGDWIDAALTATYQGHQWQLAQTQAQLVTVCSAGGPLPTSRFKANSGTEGLTARGGAPGSSDWEWQLGRDSTHEVRVQGDWVPGKTYDWTLAINAAGQGTFTVSDGASVVSSGTYQALGKGYQLRNGDALQLRVASSSDAGAATVAASIVRLAGQSVSAGVATTGPGQSHAVAFYEPALATGVTAEGTVRLDFTGSAPPLGTRLQMNVQAGTAVCD